MDLPPHLLHYATYQLLWYDISNMTFLTVTPTYSYLITKMDSLLKKQGSPAAQVTEALKIDIYEWKIVGWHKKMRLVEFSSSARMKSSK